MRDFIKVATLSSTVASIVCLSETPAVSRWHLKHSAEVAFAAESADRVVRVGAQSPENTNTMVTDFELRPGVVIDTVAGVAYVMKPRRVPNGSGGIDAVNLATGKTIWSTSAAAKPLAVFDDRLVAEVETTGAANALPITELDTKDAGRVVLTASVPMPPGVWPSIDEGLGRSFEVKAGVARSGDRSNLFVWWKSTQRTISGIARPGPQPEKRDEGAARIDLATGKVEAMTIGQATARLNAGEPTVSKPRMSGAAAMQSPPQRIGKFFVGVEAPNASGHPILKRWSAASGESLPDIALAEGFNLSVPSADESMVLAAKPAGAGASGMQDYHWSIYSLESGKVVAEMKLWLSSAPFFVWHDELIFVTPRYLHRVSDAMVEEPLGLRALNLKTGTEMWKTAVRDVAYRGPRPPTP